MKIPRDPSRNARVLLLAATSTDAANATEVLQRVNAECYSCKDVPELCVELKKGVGVILLADETVNNARDFELLRTALNFEPEWSKLPVILVAKGGTESVIGSKTVQLLSNVLVLDRPVSISTMVSAVLSSLSSRERQYDLRDHLEQLRQTEEALRDADRRKDEFLAVLAHELRNPMAAISAAANLLSKKELSAERFLLATTALKHRVSQLSRLVDDLLDVSKITRSQISLQQEVLDLGDIVRAAVEATRGFFEERQQSLEVSTSEPIVMKGDPVRLEQVVSNLLTNASRYTPAGGRASVTLIREGVSATLRVRDSGIGIPKHLLEDIFELFSQVDDSLHRSQSGLGVGLTLVKKLTQMHGGTVVASSEGPNMGSEVIVRFPLPSCFQGAAF